jgi:peptidoglycan/LPS O-acetylase OafA/YrhL
MAATPREITRIPELDLLRFAAAVAVTFYHYVSSFPTAEQLSASFLQFVTAVTRFGYLGVDLFFMISGFVILWSAQNRTVIDFTVGRLSRLFPSFWVSMLFAAACIVLAPGIAALIGAPPITPRVLAANATMLPGILQTPMIDGVYWTLEVEVRFYAIIFLLLLLRQMQWAERWVLAWLAVSAVGTFVELPSLLKFASLHPYGSLFASGCLFYLAMSRGFTPARVLALLAALGLSLIATLRQQENFITPDAASSWVVACTVCSFFAVFSMIALRRTPKLNSDVAYRLGALTYPLYLIHGTVGRMLFRGLEEHMGLELRLLVITLIAFGLAYLMSITVETYGRKWLERQLRRVVQSVGLSRSLTPQSRSP